MRHGTAGQSDSKGTALALLPVGRQRLGLDAPSRARQLVRRPAMVLILAGSGLLPAPDALAQAGGPDGTAWHMPYGGWNHMMGWGDGMFGGIGMLLFWGVIIVLLVVFARSFMGRSSSQEPRSGSTALDILQERYARGEIDKDEYEKRRETLSG